MIELLIAMSIMSIGILAVFALFQTGMVTIQRASTVSTAAALADSEMERFRAVRYNVIGLDDSEVATAGAIYLADPAYQAETTPSTTLSATIDAAATTLTVASAAGFPTAPFRVKIDNEVLYVSEVNGAVFTVKRGTRPHRCGLAYRRSRGRAEEARPCRFLWLGHLHDRRPRENGHRGRQPELPG